MRERVVATVLFACSATFTGILVALVAEGTTGGVWSDAVATFVAVTAVLAALVAPALAADARRRTGSRVGFVAGALLTLVSFLLTYVLTVTLLFWDGPDGPLSGFGGTLLSALAPLALLTTFGSPLLALGGAAGAAFYRTVRPTERRAT